MRSLVLTCDPRFVPQLCAELTQRFSSCPLRPLGSGVLLAEPSGTDAVKLWQVLQQDTPIFLRHMFPVQDELVMQQDELALPRLREACEPLLAQVEQGSAVAVQCRLLDAIPSYRPVDVKRAIDGAVQGRGLLATVKDPSLVLSVLVAHERAYLGLSTPRENLSSWNGGAAHYGKAKGALSRAAHKLEEACEVLDVDLRGMEQALDLGAAPGGFTSFLLERGFYVTAVDTGLLDSELLAHPRLTYIQANAKNIKPQEASFDLITCDISRDALRTADMLMDLAPCLRPMGKLLLTVKFMGREPLPLIRQCLKRISQEFVFVRGRHLWHNREEVTLYLVREAREGEQNGKSIGRNSRGRQ